MENSIKIKDIDNPSLHELAEIATKYSIEPGTRHYFRAGHPSGLGGMRVYFPNSLEKILSASAHSKEQNIKQEQVLQSHQTEHCQLLSFFVAGYRHFRRKPWRWLQLVQNFFRLSFGRLLKIK